MYPFKSNLHVVYRVEFLRKKNPVRLPIDTCMLLAMFLGNNSYRDQHQKDFDFDLKSDFNRFLFYLNFLLHFLSIFYPVVILQENWGFFFSKTGAGWRCVDLLLWYNADPTCCPLFLLNSSKKFLSEVL